MLWLIICNIICFLQFKTNHDMDLYGKIFVWIFVVIVFIVILGWYCRTVIIRNDEIEIRAIFGFKRFLIPMADIIKIEVGIDVYAEVVKVFTNAGDVCIYPGGCWPYGKLKQELLKLENIR